MKRSKQPELVDQGFPEDAFPLLDKPLVEFEPTPTEKRKMLIAGVEDFDAKVKPETAEEAVDNFLAKNASILASAGLPPVDRGFDDFDWANDDCVILHEQRATAVYRNKFDGVVIRQEKSWDEESDPYVVISEANFVTFMEALAKRARE